jgi:hypothetical protein
MVTRLSQITIDLVKVFDGFGQELFSCHFGLQVNEYGIIDVDPRVIDANQFKNLNALLDESATAQIVEAKKFKC